MPLVRLTEPITSEHVRPSGFPLGRRPAWVKVRSMLTTARSSSKPPPSAWRDARDLLWAHRRRLMVGFALLILSRLSGFALPASSQFLVDEAITRRHSALLGPLAASILAATLAPAPT